MELYKYQKIKIFLHVYKWFFYLRHFKNTEKCLKHLKNTFASKLVIFVEPHSYLLNKELAMGYERQFYFEKTSFRPMKNYFNLS